MKKRKSLEERSPKVQEIIGQLPHWLIRWGMSVVFFVVVTLVSLAWFIRYPETIDAPVKIKEISGYKFIADGLLDEKYFIDIKTGQAVLIKLTGYPFQEYGVLRGNIIEKSGLDNNRQFQILVGLGQELRTSYDKEISYYPNMTGQVQIILRNPKLINRIFSSFIGKERF